MSRTDTQNVFLCRVPFGGFPTEASVIRLVCAVLADTTTNGKPATAATSPKDRWHCSTQSAILHSSPNSTAATEAPRITSSSHHSAGHGPRGR